MKSGSPVSLSSEIIRFEPRDSVVRFGLIALATDLTSEGDLYRQLPQEGVAIHATRIPFKNPTTPENLREMAPRLTAAAELLVPIAPLHAVCYSCTAASVAIGSAEIVASINSALPGVPVVTPVDAAIMAFSALGAGRIAILTPYIVETSEPMAEYFSVNGLDVIRLHCFGIEDDRDMAHVSRASIVNAAIAVDHAEADALFLSCTGLPAVGAIAEIEEKTGKPVVTSNQASAWAMARLGGLKDYRPAEFGRLFELPLPAAFAGEAA